MSLVKFDLLGHGFPLGWNWNNGQHGNLIYPLI
ncbi:Uncharacterised protein [Vibrio cholerae]|nr:Uncharacterised protein [Vibrio cholerae]